MGIAFCVTLMTEAQNFAKLLGEAGLDPIPVCCRVGAVDYREITAECEAPVTILVVKGRVLGHNPVQALR
ncbi:MAG: DUF1847 domain-containing protein [Desulfitobacteriaceae bacterium]